MENELENMTKQELIDQLLLLKKSNQKKDNDIAKEDNDIAKKDNDIAKKEEDIVRLNIL